MKRVFVLFVLLLVAVFFFFEFFNMSKEKEEPQITTANITTQTTEEIKETKIYAVWLTYSEIGSFVKNKTESEYKETLETVFGNLKDNKINTVFYQCRAFCDSFYNSEVIGCAN